MVFNFPGINPLRARARKAPLAVVVLIGLILLGAAAVLACCNSYFTWTPAGLAPGDGMMPPDPPAPPGGLRRRIIKHHGNGVVYTYEAVKITHSSMTVLRNGVPWLTIANKDGIYLIGDPRGTDQEVIRASAPPGP